MSVITQVSAVAFRAGYRELVAAVKAAGIVESRRGTDRVFFDVTDDSVVVAAATPSRVVNVQLPAEDPAVGRLVLGHNALSKALAAAGKGCRKADLDRLQVVISSDAGAGTAQLAVDGYTIPLAVLSHDSFPDQISPPTSRVRVQRDAFAAMFGRVRAAASNDALVPVVPFAELVELCGGRDRCGRGWRLLVGLVIVGFLGWAPGGEDAGAVVVDAAAVGGRLLAGPVVGYRSTQREC